MEITDYTTFGEVRTACGLTEHDISDEMLGANMFSDELYIALTGITLPESDPGPGNFITRYEEISADNEVDRTAKEILLLSLTRLFSTYLVASVVSRSISLTAAKLRSDGKTTDSRFSTDLALTLTKDSILSTLAKYRLAIENINNTMVTDHNLITVVKPAVDVVTNE